MVRIWGRLSITTGLVCIAGSKSHLLSVKVRLCQGCLLSLVLFITLRDRISSFNPVVACVWFVGLRISSLLFVADVVLKQ